jgi:hypothetical protein
MRIVIFLSLCVSIAAIVIDKNCLNVAKSQICAKYHSDDISDCVFRIVPHYNPVSIV